MMSTCSRDRARRPVPERSSPCGPAAEDRAATANTVRLSSRGLGWGALNLERRDHQPSSRTLADGSRHHLVFLSLMGGHIVRSSGDERVEHALSPGCVAVVPAGIPVSWNWSTRVSFSVLRLDPAVLDRVALSVFGLQPHQYRLALVERRHDTAITSIAGVLAREAARGDRGSALYAESLANVLAVHLLREYAHCLGGRRLPRCPNLPAAGGQAPSHPGSRNPFPRTVADALALIHADYARELTLTEIARTVHLSPFHLVRLFKQALGVTPHQYLIEVRVNSARGLLAAGSGERSLAEVAVAVGFADQSHLTRHFKRLMGVTPRRFLLSRGRAAVAAGQEG
jgi:AraC family transcriptional regulator